MTRRAKRAEGRDNDVSAAAGAALGPVGAARVPSGLTAAVGGGGRCRPALRSPCGRTGGQSRGGGGLGLPARRPGPGEAWAGKADRGTGLSGGRVAAAIFAPGRAFGRTSTPPCRPRARRERTGCGQGLGADTVVRGSDFIPRRNAASLRTGTWLGDSAVLNKPSGSFVAVVSSSEPFAFMGTARARSQ